MTAPSTTTQAAAFAVDSALNTGVGAGDAVVGDASVGDASSAIALIATGLEMLTTVIAQTGTGALGDHHAQSRLEELITQVIDPFQKFETLVASLAGKIAVQSDPELGIDSMAGRYGHRSAASLLTDICKLSYADANRFVQVGHIIETAPIITTITTPTDVTIVTNEGNTLELANDDIPTEIIGRIPVINALKTGQISTTQALEINRALDKTKDTVDSLTQAGFALSLIDASSDLTVSGLKNFAEKKALTLKTETPLEAEQRIREKRYLTIGRMDGGLYPLRGLLDPESAALIKAVFDDANNPNRETSSNAGALTTHAATKAANTSTGTTNTGTGTGAGAGTGTGTGTTSTSSHAAGSDTSSNTGSSKPGRRAPNTHIGNHTASPVHDCRTTGQKYLDRLIELIQAGLSADPNQIYTGNKPAVKLIAKIPPTIEPKGPEQKGAEQKGSEQKGAEQKGSEQKGAGWIEGIDVPVSAETALRHICNNGSQLISTDATGIPLNLDRIIRTFTPYQKQALVIRDGGCLWPGCDRPPSWCEAHHVTWWEKGGKTNLDNGILLCRHHHMEIHNYGWQIIPATKNPQLHTHEHTQKRKHAATTTREQSQEQEQNQERNHNQPRYLELTDADNPAQTATHHLDPTTADNPAQTATHHLELANTKGQKLGHAHDSYHTTPQPIQDCPPSLLADTTPIKTSSTSACPSASASACPSACASTCSADHSSTCPSACASTCSADCTASCTSGRTANTKSDSPKTFNSLKKSDSLKTSDSPRTLWMLKPPHHHTNQELIPMPSKAPWFTD